MTIEEIQAELLNLRKAMGEAGVGSPHAELWLRPDENHLVNLSGKGFPHGQSYEFISGDTPAECIAKAWAFIRALPDPEQAILTTYSRKLADAIDYGHENNVPAKLVDPVRRAQKAVSDALLPAPSAA